MIDESSDEKFLPDFSGIRSVGRYEIQDKLGHGGTAVVLLGRDPYSGGIPILNDWSPSNSRKPRTNI